MPRCFRSCSGTDAAKSVKMIYQTDEAINIIACLHVDEYESLYAFRYTPKHPISKEKGWKLFKPEHEFARMGLPNKHWCLSELNKEYQLCDTYPSVLVLPTSCSEEVVFGSAKFRSRMRLPSLTYFYEPKGVSLKM